MYNEGIKTFYAGEALEARRRVKIESGTVTTPPEVVYADAGEDFIGVTEYAVADGALVAVRLNTYPGTFEIECLVDSAIARGTVLYGAADGRVSDASSGTAQGVALEVGADYQHIECAMWNVKSTTAATVSILDSGTFTAAATVEAALAEIYQHLTSIQQFIPIPLSTVLIGDATNNAGYMTAATNPNLDMANGDTDSGLLITWTAENDEIPVLFQVPLPPSLNEAKDLVLHIRAAMESTNDTPALNLDSYFNEGDTKVSDATAAITGATFAEYTATIAAADVPAGAQTVTIEITPDAHSTDDLYISAIWLEYAGTILAS